MGTITFPLSGEIVQGDTISKKTFAFGVDDEIDLLTCTIKMQLYTVGNRLVYTAENGNGITIIDSKTFEIDKITKEDNNFPNGILNGDIEITEANGVKFTFVRVNYKITKQFTK